MPSGALHRTVYMSTAVGVLRAEELDRIYLRSKSANSREGITGLMLFYEGVFLQVLEGGRSAVNKLYNRIGADPRHTDVELLLYEEIGELRFASWSIGQVNMSRLNPSLLLKYSATAALDPFSVSGKVSLALFEELVATASVIGHA